MNCQQQKTLISTMFLLCLIVIFNAGCTSTKSSSGPGGSSTASSSEVQYSPKQSISQFGPDRFNGTYSGIYLCGGVTKKFTMNVNSDTGGRVSGTIERTNLEYNFRGKRIKPIIKTQSNVRGKYDKKTSTLSLSISNPNNQRRPFGKQYKASVNGMLMPDGSAFVLFYPGRSGDRCSSWIAKRSDDFPDEWEFLEEEAHIHRKPGTFETFSIVREQKKDRSRSTCDPVVLKWLEPLNKMPSRIKRYHQSHLKIMYSDKYFVPAFGKPFYELSKKEREIYLIRMRGSCMRDHQAARIGHGHGSRVLQSFNSRSSVVDVDKSISAIGYNMLFAWFDLAEKHLAHMAEKGGEPESVKRYLRTIDPILKTLFHWDRDALVSNANQQHYKMIIPRLTKDLDKELIKSYGSFSTLEHLAEFEARSLRKYPEVDTRDLKLLIKDKISNKVNHSVLKAAARFANESSGMAGFNAIGNWRRQYSDMAGLLYDKNMTQVQQILNQRRMQIGLSILKIEKQNFVNTIGAMQPGLKALGQSLDYEDRFKKQYQALSKMPGYTGFEHMRKQERIRLLDGAIPAVERMISRQPHASSLRKQVGKYIVASDRTTAPGKKIYAMVERRFEAIAPFSGGNFSVYLNALYTYDYELLRHMDALSAAPVIKASKQLRDMMKHMGTLAEWFSGGTIPGQKIMKSYDKKLEHMSLIYPMMAFYVLNYEKYNATCIESNAEERTVQYRWKEFETDDFGIKREVDSGGHDTKYMVNQRFLPIFSIIYESDADRPMAKLVDRFLKGNGKIYRDELIAGTKKLMRKDCNSKLIKKMEKNMIRYFYDVKRRMDKVTRDTFRR